MSAVYLPGGGHDWGPLVGDLGEPHHDSQLLVGVRTALHKLLHIGLDLWGDLEALWLLREHKNTRIWMDGQKEKQGPY